MPVSQGRVHRHIRAAFVSDLHLGARHSQPEAFLTWLETVQPDSLYLVGDIIDGWQLRRGFRWPPVCSDVLTRLSELVRHGTRVFYTPGNHDSFLRSDNFIRSLSRHLYGIQIADEFHYETADGRRLMVTHGDLFDSVETGAQWLSKLTTVIYDPLLGTNRLLSRIRCRDDRSPYAMCARIKKRVKQMVRFISHYEERLLHHARQHDCDGVICGHVHTPSIVRHGTLTYYNTGDWVENCTALVESHDGQFSLEYYYSGDRIDSGARVMTKDMAGDAIVSR